MKEETKGRKQKEKSPLESEEKYRYLFKMSQMGIWVIDQEGHTSLVSPSMEKILGFSPAEMKGKHLFAFMDEKASAIAQANLERRQDGIQEQHDFEFLHKDGHRVFTTLETAPILDEAGEYVGAIAGVVDITERKKMETALRLNENRFRMLYNKTPAMMHSIDHEGNILSVSDFWLKKLGYAKKEVVGQKSILFLTEKSRQDAVETYLPQFYRDGYIDDVPYQFIKKNGEVMDVLLSAVSEQDESGAITKTLAVSMDVTDRLKAERALLESEARYRSLVEFSSEHIFMLNQEGCFLASNDRVEQFQLETGRSLVDRHLHEVYAAATAEQYRKHVNHVVATGEVKVFETILDQGAGVRYHQNTLYPISQGGEVVAVGGICRDMTHQKRLDAQLRQAKKMESIGTIAGGVAHDFNNLLYMITGNAELLLEDIPEWNPIHENIKEIKSASLRAAGVVKQLLNFSRKMDQDFKPIGAIAMVTEALDFIRSTMPVGIDVHWDLPTSEISILGDPVQLNQVLMNICANGAYAMRKTGGTLAIRMRNASVGDSALEHLPDVSNGEYLQLEIRDTGPGIDAQIIEHVFDPYFTTKDVGTGSGLGLSVAHGIVKNHGGLISVDSEFGKGARFSIYLPIIDDTLEVAPQAPLDSPHSSETILFVDDEISITKMVARMLSRLGYVVESKTHPNEALDLLASQPDGIDLVITDMAMPGMTGVVLAEKLRSIRADIPIIICSGHSELIDEEKAKAMGINAYVMKPIEREAFARTIRTVLGAKKEPG